MQDLRPLSPTARTVILASASPRRHELLRMIVPGFTVAGTRSIKETVPESLSGCDVPAYLSQLKADGYADLLSPNNLLITADTVVIRNDGIILGKPSDRADACRMLRSLSDAPHTVVTGVSVSTSGRRETFSETTTVHFAPLTDDEIKTYVDRFHPLDKAGAYGIQEWIGCIGIRSIEGCFYNVMGLPLHRLYQVLRTF